MTEGRRRFNQHERVALYLAASGRCQSCGVELGPGWHADHVTPYSRSGATDLGNGQALCALCNLRKGNNMTELLDWQQKALHAYRAKDQPTFLINAFPGTGKTIVAVSIARELLAEGVIDRVIVVVPTDSLRTQWVTAAARGGLQLLEYANPPLLHADYQGAVMTYAQLHGHSGLAEQACARYSVLVVADEMHHAGTDRRYGADLLQAFGRAQRRLILTGTPWRSDEASTMPWVAYGDDGKVVCDETYGFGDAVTSGTIRDVLFHTYNGDAKWIDKGSIREAHIADDLPDADRSVALAAIFNPAGPWLQTLIRRADERLDEIRRDRPAAGGIVFAKTQDHARAVAKMIDEVTGEVATLVTTDEPNAKQKLDAYSRNRARWLVTVKMVSEGVDIPRLTVGVMATPTQTPLFFRQALGRIVRRTGDDELAEFFIPNEPRLMACASSLDSELAHKISELAEDVEIERDLTGGDAEPVETLFPDRVPLSASDAVFANYLYGTDEYSDAEAARVKAACEQCGMRFEPKMLHMVRLLQGAPAAPDQPAAPTPPIAKLHKSLRSELYKLANVTAYRLGWEPREVNAEIVRRWGARGDMTIRQLQDAIAYVGSM